MRFFTNSYRFPCPEVAAGLLLAGFACAVFFHGTQDTLYAPVIGCLSLAGITALWDGPRTERAWPRGLFPVALAAFWSYLSISLLWSQTPYISLYFFFIFSIAPFLFYTLAGATRPALFLHAIIAGAVTLALWALIQFFFLYPDYGPRIRHPFLDPNSLAGVINLALLPALAFFMTAEGRKKTAMAGVLSFLLYAALIVTQSRAGIAAAGISACVILPFLSKPTRDKKWRLAGLAAGAVFIPLLLREFSELAHHRDLAKAVFGGGAGSMGDRAAIWSSTFAMIREHPWTGTGLASFSYFYGEHRLPVDRSDGYFAHMDPLQLWAETGGIAVVLFYAAIVAALIRTIRALGRANDVKTRAAILGPFGGMVALILHTHLNYHLYMPALQTPLGVMMATWYAATASVLADQKTLFAPGRGRIAIFVIFPALLLGTNIWGLRAAMSSHYIALSAQKLNAGNLAAARGNAEAAAVWGPSSKPQIPQYEARWRIAELQQKGVFLPSGEKQKLFGEAMAHLNESLQRQPQSSFLRADRALLYRMGQDLGLVPDGYGRAASDLDAALAMDPVNVEARMERAALYMKNGELRLGLSVLEDGLRWPRPKGQPDINFLVMTARLRKQLGDTAGHDQLIALALEHAKAYGLTKPRKK